jgi:hypothetical protein
VVLIFTESPRAEHNKSAEGCQAFGRSSSGEECASDRKLL